jgi:predicted DNA-binding protein
MAIRRITISVPEETASRIKKAAGQTPVSSWVTELIEEHLSDAELDRKWQDFYRAVNPSRKDVRLAEALHGRLTKARRRRGAA